mmetsp:Transcript_30929/g.35239  ORF Transcript_30929/g.35239 Transcript_30929/m.35239 type:complete len:97 (-) Transcript_30929:22-312(-)
MRISCRRDSSDVGMYTRISFGLHQKLVGNAKEVSNLHEGYGLDKTQIGSWAIPHFSVAEWISPFGHFFLFCYFVVVFFFSGLITRPQLVIYDPQLN